MLGWVLAILLAAFPSVGLAATFAGDGCTWQGRVPVCAAKPEQGSLVAGWPVPLTGDAGGPGRQAPAVTAAGHLDFTQIFPASPMMSVWDGPAFYDPLSNQASPWCYACGLPAPQAYAPALRAVGLGAEREPADPVPPGEAIGSEFAAAPLSVLPPVMTLVVLAVGWNLSVIVVLLLRDRLR